MIVGELNEWSKKTNTELATHIPMIIRVPWKSASVGQRTTIKMELVDLYKTLVDLASLPMSAVQKSVQGESLAAVFDSPSNFPASLQQKYAFSQIGRCNCGLYATRDGPVQECGGNACCKIPITCAKDADPEICDRDTNQSHWNMNDVGEYDYMGYTMRTESWRFTAWLPFDDKTARPFWPALSDMGERLELYNLTKDDGRDFDFAGYSLNLALLPTNAALVKRFWTQLKAEVPKWL